MNRDELTRQNRFLSISFNLMKQKLTRVFARTDGNLATNKSTTWLFRDPVMTTWCVLTGSTARRDACRHWNELANYHTVTHAGDLDSCCHFELLPPWSFAWPRAVGSWNVPVTKFMSSNECGREVETFCEGTRVPRVTHSIETSYSGNWTRSSTSMDVVTAKPPQLIKHVLLRRCLFQLPSQHNSMIPITNSQISLVSTEPIQVHLSVSVVVEVSGKSGLKNKPLVWDQCPLCLPVVW